MVSRFMIVVIGALVLSVEAISTRSHYWNGTRTSTICADDCWSTSTVYPDCPEPTAVTFWSTSTVWGQIETVTKVSTQPASTITVTVTARGPKGPPPPADESSASSCSQQPTSQAWGHTPSVVTAYITQSIYIVSVQSTTETDWET